MRPAARRLLALAALAAALVGSPPACGAPRRIAGIAGDLPLASLRLPPGFSISLYARVPGARSLALSPKGILYVGSREGDRVHAVLPARDGKSGARVVAIGSGLDEPNGVAWRDGALYVAEVTRVLRFDAIDDHLDAPPEPEVLAARFPRQGDHSWKFIRFGPDGLLYVPVGAPCNICEPKDPQAGITRMRPDGAGYEVFARGIRNTVGFDWQPGTGVLWLTDNGRDWLGDDRPPDELDRAPRPGMHFGYPYCHGGDIRDPDYGAKRPCSDVTPPAQKLGPHVAALGMRFYTGAMFPAGYRNQIFIAEHGSWNRSRPIGYRVSLVKVDGARALSYQTFAQGWLENGRAWGRPVDVQPMPDGALLVSDDLAGAVYRIAYGAGR
jgi:glucose/arabinose dehydrogenase